MEGQAVVAETFIRNLGNKFYMYLYQKTYNMIPISNNISLEKFLNCEKNTTIILFIPDFKSET